jgi:DNA-binding MarR family transcriptional regulator
MDRDFSIDDEREPLSSPSDNTARGRGGSEQADSTHARGARSQWSQRSVSSDSRNPRSRDKVPERSYEVNESQAKTMGDIGTFRTIAFRDLTRVRYAGKEKQALEEVNNLLRQKLLRRSVSQPDRAVYLTLTPEGHRFLLAGNRQGADNHQVFYHGFVKPRETEHDAAIYQLYQKEAENITSSGGKVTRVILDFELKKSVNRKLAKLSSLPEEEQVQRKSEVANEHGLTVVNGRIQIPDLRLEYEDPDHNPAKVDLELATGHYRHGSLAAKSSAGFKIYASASDAVRLRRAMPDPEIMQEIFSL